MRCLSIGTTMINWLLESISGMSIYQSQGHFGIIQCLALINSHSVKLEKVVLDSGQFCQSSLIIIKLIILSGHSLTSNSSIVSLLCSKVPSSFDYCQFVLNYCDKIRLICAEVVTTLKLPVNLWKIMVIPGSSVTAPVDWLFKFCLLFGSDYSLN